MGDAWNIVMEGLGVPEKGCQPACFFLEVDVCGRTGSVFGVQVRFRREQVSIEGESRVFVRTGDSGGRGELHFCPHCASTVFWFLDAEPELIAVAIGVIGDHSLPLPLYSVYESRRFPWTDMPALADIEHYD